MSKSDSYTQIEEEMKFKLVHPEYSQKYKFPKNCEINFQLEVIENMIERIGVIDPIRHGYIRRFREIKEKIGYRPSITDMIEHGEIVSNCIVTFGSWWNFLREISELTE